MRWLTDRVSKLWRRFVVNIFRFKNSSSRDEWHWKFCFYSNTMSSHLPGNFRWRNCQTNLDKVKRKNKQICLPYTDVSEIAFQINKRINTTFWNLILNVLLKIIFSRFSKKKSLKTTFVRLRYYFPGFGAEVFFYIFWSLNLHF